MFNKIIFALFCLTVMFVFCSINGNAKKNFSNVFNDLKNEKIQTKYKDYRFSPSREDRFFLNYSDSSKIIFQLNHDYGYSILHFKNIEDSAYAIVILEEILELCKKYRIINFGYNQIYNKFSVIININNINPESLPQYKIENAYEDNGDKTKVGIIVYSYNNNYEKSKQFNKNKPIKLFDKWYYYEFFMRSNIPIL